MRPNIKQLQPVTLEIEEGTWAPGIWAGLVYHNEDDEECETLERVVWN